MTNFADTLPDLTPQLVAQETASRNHPNGEYWCRACKMCAHEFFGPKRQPLCKLCYDAQNAYAGVLGEKVPQTMKDVRELHDARVKRMSIAPYDVTPLAAGALQNLIDRVAELETLKPRVEALENTKEILVAELNRVNRKMATKRDAITELSLQENGVQLQYRGEID